MVDKPGRRKKNPVPWGKIGAAVIIAIVAVASGYYIYENYIYSPSPEYAKLSTSLGDIYVELYPACAPKTVSNFVSLSQSGFYTDLVWHRIVKGFVIQTGDPKTRGGVNSTRTTWGTGGSNTTLPLEVCGWLHNYAGYVAMAREGNQTYGLNTGTSQFYILTDNQTAATFTQLDGYYTVFGKVITGMSVVCAISKVAVYASNEQPITPVFLNNVTIISAAQAPAPQTLVSCKY